MSQVSAWQHVMQAAIAILGIAGTYMLVNANSRPKRIVAYVVLLIGQPIWVALTFGAAQWGMFVMAVAYTAVFAQGLFNALRESVL